MGGEAAHLKLTVLLKHFEKKLCHDNVSFGIKINVENRLMG